MFEYIQTLQLLKNIPTTSIPSSIVKGREETRLHAYYAYK